MPFPYKSLSLSVIETQKNIMGKFINPFTDYGFKKIFGQEVSKELLIEFLNDLLEGERVITDLTFLNNEQLPIRESVLPSTTSSAPRTRVRK